MKKEQGNEVTSSLQAEFLEMIEVLAQPLPHRNGIGRHETIGLSSLSDEELDATISLSSLSDEELAQLIDADAVSSMETAIEEVEEPEETEELIETRKHLVLESLPCLARPIEKVVIICTLDGNSDVEIAEKVKLPIDEVCRIRRHAAVHLAQALNPSTVH